MKEKFRVEFRLFRRTFFFGFLIVNLEFLRGFRGVFHRVIFA